MAGDEPLKLKFSIDETISVYNRKCKNKIKTIHIDGRTTILERILYYATVSINIVMHTNGLYTFVSNLNANEIEEIDLKKFTIISTIGTRKIPDAMAFVK
jgi:phosphatidylserine decarboxylase